MIEFNYVDVNGHKNRKIFKSIKIGREYMLKINASNWSYQIVDVRT